MKREEELTVSVKAALRAYAEASKGQKCPICAGTESCDHTVKERLSAALIATPCGAPYGYVFGECTFLRNGSPLVTDYVINHSTPVFLQPTADVLLTTPKQGRVTVAYAYCCCGSTKYCDCVNPNHGTALMFRNEAGDDYPIVSEEKKPLNLEITKEWLEKQATKEGDLEIGVGFSVAPEYLPGFVSSTADRYYNGIIAKLQARITELDAKPKPEPVGWETEAEWQLEMRCCGITEATPFAEVSKLINDLWQQYCLAAEPKPEATEGGAHEKRIAELEDALRPFAKAGQVIDSPFGPALFREDDTAFQSGCAWSENGERKTITWGDFRRARSALTAKEGSDNG